MRYKLGKLPATKPKMRFAAYMKTAALPTPPPTFGWDHLVTTWNMYANDRVGCCVFAGAGHEQLLWAASGRKTEVFSDETILSDYSAVTGYNPDDPSTDTGTNVQTAAEYRRTVGLLDTNGTRHKVGAYLALNPDNLDQFAAAAWIFGAVGLGIQVPAFIMDQTDAGKPWDVQRCNRRIEGGHYVPIVGRANGMWRVITWGKEQLVTSRFLKKYCDEAYVYLSTDQLFNGVNLSGFDNAQLSADMPALTGVADDADTGPIGC